MYLTIDPGAQTGWALWTEDKLVSCGLGSLVPGISGIEDVWIEYPVIYPRPKARPADILKLAQVAAEYGGAFAARGVKVHYVEPAQWKGQLKKKIHHPRVWRSLTPGDRAVATVGCAGLCESKKHNVVDAIGLGMWVRSQGRGGK